MEILIVIQYIHRAEKDIQYICMRQTEIDKQYIYMHEAEIDIQEVNETFKLGLTSTESYV